MVAGGLLAGAASRWAGTWLWVVALIPLIAGIWLEAKTSDGFLTVRFPGTRRRSILLACGGLIGLVGGLLAHSAAPSGLSAALAIGGLGFFLASAGTLAWHSAATYAGDRIVERSDEDW